MNNTSRLFPPYSLISSDQLQLNDVLPPSLPPFYIHVWSGLTFMIFLSGPMPNDCNDDDDDDGGKGEERRGEAALA